MKLVLLKFQSRAAKLNPLQTGNVSLSFPVSRFLFLVFCFSFPGALAGTGKSIRMFVTLTLLTIQGFFFRVVRNFPRY